MWIEDGLARNTLAAYRRDLDGLAAWLGGRGTALVSAGEPELNAYFAEQHAGTRATTANRRLAVLRRFYRWASCPARSTAAGPIRACGPQIRFDNAQRAIRYSMNNSFGFGGNNCSLVFGRP